jgi:predicted permease
LTVATTEYFHALGIPLRHGRLFAETDHASAIPVAVVNETMADRLWPAGDAIGRRVSVNWRGQWRTVDVVGVVGGLRHEGLESAPRPELFMPLQQAPFGSMTFVVRTVSEPAPLLPSLRRQIWAVDPSLPFFATATVDDLLADSIAPRRFVTMLLTLLGLLGFIIAVSGIYGVISYLTESRTREFGVRMALGARTADIRRLVLGRASVLSGAGVLLGLIVCAVVTQSIESMLFDVTTLDGATYVATAAIFALAALLAAFGPARRATSVDPFTALRSE